MDAIAEKGEFLYKKEIISYAIFLAFLFNEEIIQKNEMMIFLFHLINYNVKTRLFKVSTVDNINDTFRISIILNFLEYVNPGQFKHLEQRVFLILFQMYVVSKNYVQSLQEFKVLEVIRRLYPLAPLIKKEEDIGYILRLVRVRCA
jgi:hypothetical protein